MNQQSNQSSPLLTQRSDALLTGPVGVEQAPTGKDSYSNGSLEEPVSPLSKEGSGSSMAAPSKKRGHYQVKGYDLTNVSPQTRYTLAAIARTLGCSTRTVRRLHLRRIDDGTSRRKYLGLDVINRLQGRYE